jgi:hypothetical protein
MGEAAVLRHHPSATDQTSGRRRKNEEQWVERRGKNGRRGGTNKHTASEA